MSETNPHLAAFVPPQGDSDDDSDAEEHPRVTRLGEEAE